jgi:hypothetical protein
MKVDVEWKDAEVGGHYEFRAKKIYHHDNLVKFLNEHLLEEGLLNLTEGEDGAYTVLYREWVKHPPGEL